jgi:hypothetical protein
MKVKSQTNFSIIKPIIQTIISESLKASCEQSLSVFRQADYGNIKSRNQKELLQ